MEMSQALSQMSASDVPLPPQFEALEAILDMPNERLKQNPFVNVIGVVTDYQPPIATRGTDWKSTCTIIDTSNMELVFKQMKLIIFWPKEKMPHISGVGDVILARNVKVQMWSGHVSLLANRISQFSIYRASTIPPWPVTAMRDLPRAETVGTSRPTSIESSYVAWLHSHIDKDNLPTAQEFELRAIQAGGVRAEKFALMQDVRNNQFCDMIGEAIHIYDSGDRLTLYVSDYTSNSLLYDQKRRNSESGSDGRDGDQYGYTKVQQKSSDWPGPYGKLSIQISVWDAHATFVREQVRTGDWVKLRNVHIKMGNQGGCLEGFLRGDRNAHENKVQVEVLDATEDPETIDPRHKDCIRRKRDYWTKFKKQQKKVDDAEEVKKKKRKLEEESSKTKKKNDKKRRKKEKAAAALQKTNATERQVEDKLKEEEQLDLNINVKSAHQNIPTIPLADVLDIPRTIELENGNLSIQPFKNFKFRANVRVVDFYPDKLEDFAKGRNVTEFDVLSDYSGDESSDPEEDMRRFRNGEGYGGHKKWEWKFALKVEDFGLKDASRKETAWLSVNNESAQMLLNLDAANLRQEKALLETLRTKLFTLWGDLEEKKLEYLKKQKAAAIAAQASQSDTMQPPPPPTKRKTLDDPPDDSDDEAPPPAKRAARPPPLSSRDPNIVIQSTSQKLDLKVTTSGQPLPQTQTPTQDTSPTPLTDSSTPYVASNKGFTCVIYEYGVKIGVEDEDIDKEEGSGVSDFSDAGNGKRWQRMWGLFETMIL